MQPRPPDAQRVARWLLQLDERVDEVQFDVTQEFMAEMLGVQRPQVTLPRHEFKEAGLIRYTRRQVEILDHAGLEERACSCFRVIRSEEERLYASAERYDPSATAATA